MTKRVRVIINPAAGQDIAILGILNAVFHPLEIIWAVAVTLADGDAKRHAQQAVKDGVDVVAVYGGDGTVAEVASGLIGSGVPMAIFPGGTANVMSIELGIPSDLAEACALACSEEQTLLPVDMGQVGERSFLLRVGIGLEAAMVEGADRTLKDKIGVLAYALSAFQALNDPPISQYQLTLDGETIQTEGFSCLICNSGNLGRKGLSLSNNVSIQDGLLDVFILQHAHISYLLAVIKEITQDEVPEGHQELLHWQAREVTVEANPPQQVQADGEVLEDTPVRARIIPSAIQIIVPSQPPISEVTPS
jgi:diacylglycerol kinase (ATP)